MAKLETKNISISYDVYQNINELEEKDQFLLEKAKEAMANAYAPYSDFKVGAAVELDNGIIITGNNQENAAYPSGLCAERTAIFYASAQYPHQKMKTIAVITQSEATEPVTPCGACRQAMAEYQVKFQEPIKVIIGSASKIYVLNGVQCLLPLMFGKDNLK